MLDLILTNNEGLVGNVKLNSSLGCSDHEIVGLKFLRAARRAHSTLTALDFKRTEYGSSGVCSIECHGIKPWREKGPKKAV